MNIRILLVALALMVISPVAFADEMGTGSPGSTNQSSPPAMPADQTEQTAASGHESCELWKLFLSWFE